MWVRYGASYCSLWIVSHLRLGLYSIHFCLLSRLQTTGRVVRANTFTTWVFYSSLFALFCFPFLPNLLTCPETFLSSHIPPNRGQYSVAHLYRCQFQHSHQWYVSITLSACPAPFLSQWMDPSTQCSESDSDLWWTYTYENVSQSLDPVYEDVCTFIILPFSIVSLWFFCFWKCVFGCP